MNLNLSVSVIIPCFNQGLYIEETINSLLNQSKLPDEIIIVNDGSTDVETINTLERLKGIKRIFIVHTENKGPAAARNLGFRKSAGEFILLIDSDDSIHFTFIEKSIEILQACPKIGVVSAWALCFGHEDGIWYPPGGVLKDFMKFTACPSCALLRRETWNSANGFDEGLVIGYEDWDFWIRVTKHGWIIYIIPEILYYYLQKKNSRVKDTYLQHAEIYKIIKANHPDVFSSQGA